MAEKLSNSAYTEVPKFLVSDDKKELAYWCALTRAYSKMLSWKNPAPLLYPKLLMELFFLRDDKTGVNECRKIFDQLADLDLLDHDGAKYYRIRPLKKGEAFVAVPISTLKKIHREPSGQADLLAIYCFVMSMRGSDTGYTSCSFSQEYLASRYGVSIRTLQKYLARLEELHIIYRKQRQFQGGSGEKFNNIYVAYEDRELIDGSGGRDNNKRSSYSRPKREAAVVPIDYGHDYVPDDNDPVWKDLERYATE